MSQVRRNTNVRRRYGHALMLTLDIRLAKLSPTLGTSLSIDGISTSGVRSVAMGPRLTSSCHETLFTVWKFGTDAEENLPRVWYPLGPHDIVARAISTTLRRIRATCGLVSARGMPLMTFI